MKIWRWLQDNWNKPLPQPSAGELSAKSVAIMQFLHSGFGIALSVSLLFDGTVAALPRAVQGLAFLVVALCFVFGWLGLILGYGLWARQGWAWVGTLILQGLNALAALSSIGSWFDTVASHTKNYPNQALPDQFGLPLLVIQLGLSATIVSGLFKCREEFFDAE